MRRSAYGSWLANRGGVVKKDVTCTAADDGNSEAEAQEQPTATLLRHLRTGASRRTLSPNGSRIGGGSGLPTFDAKRRSVNQSFAATRAVLHAMIITSEDAGQGGERTIGCAPNLDWVILPTLITCAAA